MTNVQRDRLLHMDSAKATEFWTRIQRARHRQGVAHYRRLIEPDTNRVCVDLGECECPLPKGA
jgi:hypothetical protein